MNQAAYRRCNTTRKFNPSHSCQKDLSTTGIKVYRWCLNRYMAICFPHESRTTMPDNLNLGQQPRHVNTYIHQNYNYQTSPTTPQEHLHAPIHRVKNGSGSS